MANGREATDEGDDGRTKHARNLAHTALEVRVRDDRVLVSRNGKDDGPEDTAVDEGQGTREHLAERSGVKRSVHDAPLVGVAVDNVEDHGRQLGPEGRGRCEARERLVREYR